MNQFDQLVEEGERLLVAPHQRFLGEVDGGGFVLSVREPSLQCPEQILVQLAAGIGQRGLHAVEAAVEWWGWPRFHAAVGFEAELVRAAQEPQPQNFIATGRQQLPPLAGFRQHGEGVVEQTLETVAPWFEAEAMLPQGDRDVVAVGQAVNDVGTHGEARGESCGVSGRSLVVK